MTPKQAQEIVALIRKKEISSAFSRLSKLGIDDFSINNLKQEFKLGKTDADFHQRFIMAVEDLTDEVDIPIIPPITPSPPPNTVLKPKNNESKKNIFAVSLFSILAIPVILLIILPIISGDRGKQGGGGGKDTTQITRPPAPPSKKEIVNKMIKMVSIPNTLYSIGETEVTQELWIEVMGKNPARKDCPKCPVQYVSYRDVTQEFLPKLNEITGEEYILPDNNLWMQAAEAGEKTRYAGSNDINKVAVYKGFKGDYGGVDPVKTKKPNALGLYDMSGNVSEWTSTVNPTKPKAYLAYGGSWTRIEKHCTTQSFISQFEDTRDQFTGFRLCKKIR